MVLKKGTAQDALICLMPAAEGPHRAEATVSILSISSPGMVLAAFFIEPKDTFCSFNTDVSWLRMGTNKTKGEVPP
jgi:hypothetical protein